MVSCAGGKTIELSVCEFANPLSAGIKSEKRDLNRKERKGRKGKRLTGDLRSFRRV